MAQPTPGATPAVPSRPLAGGSLMPYGADPQPVQSHCLATSQPDVRSWDLPQIRSCFPIWVLPVTNNLGVYTRFAAADSEPRDGPTTTLGTGCPVPEGSDCYQPNSRSLLSHILSVPYRASSQTSISVGPDRLLWDSDLTLHYRQFCQDHKGGGPPIVSVSDHRSTCLRFQYPGF